MDYTILAMVLICVGTSVALGIELYKAAEDAPPPFRRQLARVPRFGGNVVPVTARRMVVEYSDGRAAKLPLGDMGPLTRFEELLRVAVDHAAVR